MKTKKLLSILLALMMMLSVVPMYASAAEALKATNVTQWPTLSYKNEQTTVCFGQTIEDALVINDDEIVVDASGNQVAGHFEFMKPSLISNPGTNIKSNIKFVPDDTETYTGFNKLFSSLTYDVEKVTPVFVDETNDPIVATKVEAGATLSTSTISGGKMANPYNAEEPNILAASWSWVDSRTVVTESGYYDVHFNVIGYNEIVKQVYVEVNHAIVETTVSETPTISELTYDSTTKWSDLTLTGGVAVEKDTTNVVEGVFSIADNWKNKVVEVGTHEIDVTFIPNDTEAYTKAECKISVTVNKAPIRFVDENGEDIVPEITVPYGTKFNDISRLLKPYVKGPEYIYFVMGDLSSQICANGTYTVTATAPSDGAHYEDTELTFKIVVEPKVINPKAYSSTEGYYVYDNSGVYHVEGTFDFYIDGELYKSGVKYLEKVAYTPEKSGTHDIKFVYKPVENDNFAIENEITVTVTVNLTHKLTSSDNVGTFGDFRNGTAIELVANIAAENFAGWKITDAKGNEVTLDGVDNSKTKITITMPDYDIHVEALEKNATSGGSGGLGDIDFGDLSEGDSEWAIINIIRNIIAMFKSFLQQLIETFQSIGD